MKMQIRETGTRGFLLWTKKNLPRTYAGISKELKSATRLAGMGLTAEPAVAATETPPTSSLVNTIRDVANMVGQVYLTREQLKAQQKVLDMQLQRAANGLPPADIDVTQYGLPQPSVGISLDDSTKKILMWGGIGLAVAIVLGLIGGGRAARRAH